MVATIPWRQRRLINACSDDTPPPPKPTPADPCRWKVYSGGYNISATSGPKGNIGCGGHLDALLAQCCKNAHCASVSWVDGSGCMKPDTKGGWESRATALSYVPTSRPAYPPAPDQDQDHDQQQEPQQGCPPQVIVRSAVTALEVRNVLILNASREVGTIAFQPEFGPGEYHACKNPLPLPVSVPR